MVRRRGEVAERASVGETALGRSIGEGFDDPRLDTLVLAIPIAWSGTMTQ
jgi:hypothetical protein